MKSLTILRHGKASRSEEYPIDYDCPLTKRGPKDIAKIGRVLQNLTPTIDWIISSPARRTRQTAELVREGLSLQSAIIWQESLYNSNADSALQLLCNTPNEVQHVLMVGHNPTLEQLISGICTGYVSHLSCSLPTSGAATMECQIMLWEQLRWGCGTLIQFVRPRLLRKP